MRRLGVLGRMMVLCAFSIYQEELHKEIEIWDIYRFAHNGENCNRLQSLVEKLLAST
jgi:hypothetical protein